MKLAKKMVAEFIGTMVLVIMGCGTAMLVGCDSGEGYILTAAAFGLSIVAMAYSVGNVSGCHINPAVSLGVLISGGITVKEFFAYVIAQCLGGFAGSGILAFIFNHAHLVDRTGAFGSNGLAGINESRLVGFGVEVILTAIFVFTILGVTSKNANHGSFGGLVIGATLTFVHIFGIGMTGTSVNPARSFGPALVAAISGNTKPISQIWIFIIAPLVGAVIAALVYKFIEIKKQD